MIVIAVVSYLLGSIPFGYILVRIFRGEDVRLSGSGNIGATNVSRKYPVLGIITLVLDALKGSSAVWLAQSLSNRAGEPLAVRAMALAAFLSVVGHMFPVWLKFRGGKGVATGLGAFLVLAPMSVLIAAAIFVLLVLVFRYVSLGSILAVAAFPVSLVLRHEYGNDAVALALMALTSLLIIARHHQNIRRLFAGTENRFGSKRAQAEGATQKQ